MTLLDLNEYPFKINIMYEDCVLTLGSNGKVKSVILQPHHRVRFEVSSTDGGWELSVSLRDDKDDEVFKGPEPHLIRKNDTFKTIKKVEQGLALVAHDIMKDVKLQHSTNRFAYM